MLSTNAPVPVRFPILGRLTAPQVHAVILSRKNGSPMGKICPATRFKKCTLKIKRQTQFIPSKIGGFRIEQGKMG